MLFKAVIPTEYDFVSGKPINHRTINIINNGKSYELKNGDTITLDKNYNIDGLVEVKENISNTEIETSKAKTTKK